MQSDVPGPIDPKNRMEVRTWEWPAMQRRLAAADTIVFFDLPRWLCFWRVLKRRIRYHRRTRTDMGVGCAERVEWEFLTWIGNYRKNSRPAILERLRELEIDKQVIILDSRAVVEQFMMQLCSGRYMAETAAGSQETQHEDLR